jgi:hypothetical protein
MGFQLPVLETDVDCEALGYPGLVFTFWLNATNPEEEWESPAERDPPVEEPEPWDRLWYVSYARALLRITIPAEFSDTGKEEVLEISDAKAAYELERMPGFDRSILHWALMQVGEQRQERLEVAVKN